MRGKKMAKSEKSFYCSECGTRYPKWLGKCEDCGQWNTIVEDIRVGSGNGFCGIYGTKTPTT
jgi:DNA repair protein RadA/Sms